MDFFSGFLLGISLIFAIGSQNAFIIKKGLKHQHVFAVCLFCAVSDALLISAGVGGFGAVTQKYPNIINIAKIAGALFLLIYGLQSLYASFTKDNAMDEDAATADDLKKSLLLCFGFTWLNPHVYLDTLVLMGMVSTGADNKILFTIGAVTASFIFFFSLGYGAKKLSPIFANSRSWNILDGCVGLLMLALSYNLYFL